MSLRSCIALLAGSLCLATPVSAETPGPEEVAKRLGLSEAAIERVRKGEVVVEELDASSDKDLALALVAALDAPLAKVKEFVAAEKMAELSTITLSQGDIDTETFSLDAMTLPDDVLEQLVDDPTDTFFLSKAEAAKVEKAAEQGKAQALSAYREVLSARAKAYWEGGLAAVEPYDGDGRSPREDLAHANEVIRKLMKNPSIRGLLDVVPAKAGPGAVHELEWAVQKGRDQAAPVLTHRIVYTEEDGQVVIGRRFYSGYDYDSLQIVAAVLPASATRSVVFYTNHTYTAQVAGFGGGAKRSIGRKLMGKELEAEIERAQKAVAGGS